MDWRVKALLQASFSVAPRGEQLNYFMQRYVTKSLPVSEHAFIAKVSCAKRHIEAIHRHVDRPLGQTLFYEFGAGWDIATALGFYGFGVERQILVDIRALVKVALVNDMIAKYRRMSDKLGIVRPPPSGLDCERSLLPAVLQKLGIDYRAPCDPGQTGLPDQSVDCITSTSTLEHIPEKGIRKIARECHRILRADGIMSMLIDYDDHYSYFDQNISPYNYLQYSDRVWRLFNPSLQYQNRLRHRDYVELFQAEGFDVSEDQHSIPTEADLDALSHIPLSNRFRIYCAGDLAVHSGLLVLRKRLEPKFKSNLN